MNPNSYSYDRSVRTYFNNTDRANGSEREVPVLAQSDLLAKSPHSGYQDVGGIYHVIVRLSLEPYRHFLGLTGRWRFPNYAVGASCMDVCLQLFEPSLSTQMRWSQLNLIHVRCSMAARNEK